LTEIQKYEVVEASHGFEIRDYAAFITLSTIESGGVISSGYSAFGKLAGFIFGGNLESKNIAMTSPVTKVEVADGFEVSFVMPHGMTMSDMPTPKTANLKITEHKAARYAAITFSGAPSDATFRAKAKKLKGMLLEQNHRVDSEPLYARYDGPWTPFFKRRNEVLFALSD
jgi:hypothetical protein